MNNRFQFWSFLILFQLHFFLPAQVYSQASGPQKIDSLRNELSQKAGAKKIAAQLELALDIQRKEKDEALELANSALELARKDENQNLEMRAYYVLGRIYFSDGDHDLANNYFSRALELSDAIDENWYKGEILFRQGVIEHQKGEALQALEHFNESVQACRLSGNFKIAGSSFSMMGTIFRLNGLYDRAIEYIIKSKLNYEKAEFAEGDAWAAYLLGRIYADLKIPDNAMEYFQEALEKYKKLAVIDGRKNGIAICYEQIGLIHLKSGNLEEAQKNINLVLEIHKESGSEYGLSNAYKILGRIEYYKGNYNKAEEYLTQALDMKMELNDLLSQPSIFEYIGLCLIAKGNTEEGFNNILKGLDLAISNGQKKIQLEIYSNLSEAHLKLNNLEKGILYLKKQIETQNSILTGTANIKIDQLQAIYEIDEKNNLIADLEKQNEINTLRLKQQRTYQIMMIIGSFSIAVILLIILLFYNKLRRKNSELIKINTTKDKLFSIIAHDLKGPIGSSLALSRIVAEENETDKPPTANDYSALIYQSLDSSYNLLNNLLEWARSQFQKMEFKPQELFLLDAVDDIKDQMLSQFQKKGIRLEVDFPDSQQIFADEGMLKTILRNLLSNAVKFSNPNGKIIISTKKEGEFTTVSVQDFGVGIEPEIIPRLFEFNSNVSRPGTMGEIGTGLGLNLVKEFVEKQGGEIWVESKAGKGSEFKFTLPVN